MGWILFIVFQGIFIWSGLRQSKREGAWSWSKFVFALGFAALEAVILCTPLFVLDMTSRYFWPVYIAAWVVAAGNFVWFIMVCRRWKLPDGRTSLEADRDARRQGQ